MRNAKYTKKESCDYKAFIALSKGSEFQIESIRDELAKTLLKTHSEKNNNTIKSASQ